MNAASDESPGERIALAESTASPGQAGPETLIIGHDPRATRNDRGDRTQPPGGARSRSSTFGRPRPRVQMLLTALTTAVIVLFALVVIAVGTGSEWRRCPDSYSAEADVRRLRQLTQAEHQALIATDTKRLKTLLAADFALVTPDGEVMPGKDLIAAVGSGDLDFRSFRIDESDPNDAVEIRLDCDIATVSYRSEMDVASDPLHFRHESRHTDTWIRSGGSWKQLRGHTTAVGGFPPPGQ
jgi:hypothetical protein